MNQENTILTTIMERCVLFDIQHVLGNAYMLFFVYTEMI
jgi:hypothetical protein